MGLNIANCGLQIADFVAPRPSSLCLLDCVLLINQVAFHLSLFTFPLFHFKKFSIDDSRAAMKIGTDAVLLGAWVECENENLILDIGTGTGILALMMAQRNPEALIDAVELDSEAAKLAKQNIKLSPWGERIEIFASSIQEFAIQTQHKYSLIICNPPFFADSLKSPSETRNLARHNETLPVHVLLGCAAKLLLANGKAAFIIPADVFAFWKQEAALQSLFPCRVTIVKSSPNHKPHRVMVTFSRKQVTRIYENEISIYISKSNYSVEYQELTKVFYLNF